MEDKPQLVRPCILNKKTPYFWEPFLNAATLSTINHGERDSLSVRPTAGTAEERG